MTRVIFRTPTALRHLLDHYVFLGDESTAAADRFLRRFDETARFLADHPGVGVRTVFSAGKARGLRRWRVRGFPNHLIFYHATSRVLTIHAVYHGAKDIGAAFAMP